MRSFYVVLLLAALLGACEREGPAEKAGREIDRAVDKAGRNVEKAGESIRDAAKGK